MTSYTRQIADFASRLTLDAVPPEVIARAKGIILDGLGCALFGSDVRWTRILAGVVHRLEPKGGVASIWGRRASASAANAALVNGTMVQSYELDDVHINGHMHSCAVVLPAAFAAAEYVGGDKVDGARLLLAIIAAFEIGPRVGICMRGDDIKLNGWHSGGILTTFPAAIAAGVVLGLNSDQFFHALGIAGTQAGGLFAAQYGSMVKRMHAGKAAQSGLYAALLAADGFTGIEDVFDEKYGGYCSTFTHSTDKFDLPELVAGLGTRWETMHFTIKTYACNGSNHSAVNAIDELMAENGIKADDVAEITIAATQGMIRHGGWSPYEPKGLVGAQMHTGFCVAMRMIEGDVFVDQMVDENIGRADLVALANKVKMVRSVEREQRGNSYRKGVDMEVKLKDGRELKKTVDFARGNDLRPLSGEEMATKFRRLAAKALSKRNVTQIEKIVWELERVASVAPLIKALRGSGKAAA